MKLEDQVTSLELARKLKKLGVKQESLFWWVEIMVDYKWTGEYELKYEIPDYQKNTRAYSAFTVAELGEMLPKGLPGNYNIGGTALKISRTFKENWFCGYSFIHWAENKEVWNCCKKDKTLANAMAKMLIYLKQNKLL